ncbi:hypothetical protein M404DRAFT_991615 [Pisolithus tinctorius Marx 270]|uniref:Uncharacterized protein n=1 Tax=Pisolithus tinctorius Marx 270 TaxID=870435 RepID=A0A0C3KZK2_PISTI|nr:hypothetical protein M404DRAFT_991615 [Pisolithus tinctorius Marx 270]
MCLRRPGSCAGLLRNTCSREGVNEENVCCDMIRQNPQNEEKSTESNGIVLSIRTLRSQKANSKPTEAHA